MLLGRGNGSFEGPSAHDSLSVGGTGVDAGVAAKNAAGPSPTSCFPPASTGATISAPQAASTSITGWPTTGSAWPVSTCRNSAAGGAADPPEAKV